MKTTIRVVVRLLVACIGACIGTYATTREALFCVVGIILVAILMLSSGCCFSPHFKNCSDEGYTVYSPDGERIYDGNGRLLIEVKRAQ